MPPVPCPCQCNAPDRPGVPGNGLCAPGRRGPTAAYPQGVMTPGNPRSGEGSGRWISSFTVSGQRPLVRRRCQPRAAPDPAAALPPDLRKDPEDPGLGVFRSTIDPPVLPRAPILPGNLLSPGDSPGLRGTTTGECPGRCGVRPAAKRPPRTDRADSLGCVGPQPRLSGLMTHAPQGLSGWGGSRREAGLRGIQTAGRGP
jgi:hypothetical protein